MELLPSAFDPCHLFRVIVVVRECPGHVCYVEVEPSGDIFRVEATPSTCSRRNRTPIRRPSTRGFPPRTFSVLTTRPVPSSAFGVVSLIPVSTAASGKNAWALGNYSKVVVEPNRKRATSGCSVLRLVYGSTAGVYCRNCREESLPHRAERACQLTAYARLGVTTDATSRDARLTLREPELVADARPTDQ